MKIVQFLAAQLIAFTGSIIGNIFTLNSVNTWYQGIDKPSFNPPDYVFGPVWSVLYFLIGVSIFIVWRSNYADKKPVYLSFAAQLLLNISWSIAFFGLQSPVLGLIVISLLLVSIAYNIMQTWPVSRPAALLLAPYFAWVCFATLLNIGIVQLN